MNDMSSVIVPKSDQINADDLLAGPRTITISAVKITPGDQPVSISFAGDNGKPFKPSKGMCRIMVSIWGPDANAYVGRSMTIYRDAGVKWGGMEVGGIRISHMSHIDSAHTLALTQTKGIKKPHTVKPLKVDAPAAGPDNATRTARALADRIAAAPDMAALEAITAEETVTKQRAWLAEKRPELAKQVDDAVTAALAVFDGPAAEPAAADDTFPGDRP